MNRQNQYPWDELFYLAVKEFGISPSDFWEMTLPELIMLIKCQKKHNGENNDIMKADIAELIEKFPDI